jgi:2-polyprenyl-6-methoxyphenol hydroxylase-like FAD-dependent oxidoreductase
VGRRAGSRLRHAEIAGAGFGGLVAAVALAERGWTVRVHEKTPLLRAEGFAIAMQPNMLKVAESLGVADDVVRGGLRIVRRETRNRRNRPTLMIVGGGGYRISRQHIATVLAERAAHLGVEIASDSTVAGADATGELLLASGRRLKADLVVGADGINSVVRDRLGLLASRRLHADGALRLLVSRTEVEVAEDGRLGPATCEYWSARRRVLTSPCGARELYVAMSCLARDDTARAVPVDVEGWARSFPHLGDLFRRIDAEADWSRVRWVQFETIRLKRWHAGRVAVLGDAAHAMPPNLGQGAGCAMMNALALAVALDETADVGAALSAWEERERPLTEHTQRWSEIYGRVTTWPEHMRSLAFHALGRVKWLRRRYQKTANHVPTGYRPKEAGAGSVIREAR